MKTPIEEIIERIEDVFGKNFMPLNEQTKFLEKEKQVIIEAFDKAQEQESDGDFIVKSGENYFNETFK